jgi:Na+-translocating ferredoxin:NAD+ oxidoreductase RNF subunit RnfB
MLINSVRGFEELGLGDFVTDFHRDRLLVVPASALAIIHLGRPLPGAALLGGFAACPDNAIIKLADGQYEIDYDYCEGCGLCAAECPCGAIQMEPEQA